MLHPGDAEMQGTAMHGPVPEVFQWGVLVMFLIGAIIGAAIVLHATR